MSLLACPFCRELFSSGEAKECPVCGVALKRLEELPISQEAAELDGVPTVPELEKLPWNAWGRMRGALTVLPLIGMGAFFLPWIQEELPVEQTLSGFDLAHHGSGWIYAAFAAWSVLFPTAFSRRTIVQMRGARVAVAFLAALPGVTVLDLLIFQPKASIGRTEFEYLAALYFTLALSVVGVLAALRFGLPSGGAAQKGRGLAAGDPSEPAQAGDSAGQVLH